MSAARVKAHVLISGRVQGVWFRAWTEREAKRRELSGWVRNRRDGNVEAVFDGPQAVVEDMISACYEGPPHAQVDAVDTGPWDSETPDGFHQKPTV